MTAPTSQTRIERGLVRIPAERADHYRGQGWWRPERLDELVLRYAARTPEATAVISGDRRVSYRELAAAAHRAAGELHEIGLRRGDPVLVQLPNDLEFVVLVLACLRLGAPPVLALPALRAHEIEHVVRTTEPVAMAVPRRLRRFDHLALARDCRDRHSSLRHLLVAGEDGAGEIDLAALCRPPDAAGSTPVPPPPEPRPGPTEIAVFLLSSGTTGAPKAIARTHEDYGCAIRVSSEVSGLDEDTVYLAVMPTAHSFIFGHPGILGTLAHGGRVVLGSPDDLRATFDLVARTKVTHCALVPTLAMQWLAAIRAAAPPPDLTSLRVLQVGGARLAPVTAAQILDRLGCRVQQVYGMSEGLLNYTRLDDPDEVLVQTQGRPASPGDELCIVDPAGHPVADGEPGELLTRGPYTIAGYYRAPETNAQSFTADGFYRTGDVVRRDPYGNLTVEGRVKDVINRAGEKISCEELEALAMQHPAISRAAAVAMPHHIYGEAVCLVVVARETPPTLREVRRFLEELGLARFKLPERLEVVDQLPVVGVGKVNKRQLRQDVAERLLTERGPARSSAAGLPAEQP